MRTGYQAKREMLARVISAAALDDARIDETALYVRALTTLDAPHFRTLEALVRCLDTLGLSTESTHEDVSGVREAIRMEVGDVPTPIVTALRREGLIRLSGTYPGGEPLAIEAYRVTDFGRALLDELRSTDVIERTS